MPAAKIEEILEDLRQGKMIILVDDEDRDVRDMAAWALGQIDDTRAVDPLSYASAKDADGYVRDEAKKALGKLGVQVE